jgi:hypothetical protein
VPDQRGFGDSDRPDLGYAVDAFGDDVAAFLDAVSVERATIERSWCGASETPCFRERIRTDSSRSSPAPG